MTKCLYLNYYTAILTLKIDWYSLCNNGIKQFKNINLKYKSYDRKKIRFSIFPNFGR